MLAISPIIKKKLGEEKIKNMQDFYAYVDAQGLGVRKEANRFAAKWIMGYGGRQVGSFGVQDGSWSISFLGSLGALASLEKLIGADMKAFVWAHLNTAAYCCMHKTCNSVENAVVLGKTVPRRLCVCSPLVIVNPTGTALSQAKALAVACKNAIL